MVTPSPLPTLIPLLITEVFPKPSQGNEWVELYNPNATTVPLAGWELWDELSQPSLIFSFTTQNISAGQWQVVPINKKLNDTEDGVTLKKPDGTVSDTMQYVDSETDLSWARQGLAASDSWTLTQSSSGVANPIPTPTPTNFPIATTTPTQLPSLTPTSSIPQTLTPTTNLQTNPSLFRPQKVSTQSPALIVNFTEPMPNKTPTPFLSPTQNFTVIPTLSLQKPAPDQHSPPVPTTPQALYYFLGLWLIQLSSVSLSLSKHGMIGTNAVAITSQNFSTPARHSQLG